MSEEQVSKKIICYFTQSIWDKPIVYRLIKDYDMVFNIIKANVVPRQESFLIMELSGTKENFKRSIEYLRRNGVVVKSVEQDIHRDEDRCYHCGVCVTICPSNALHFKMETREVIFDPEACSGCGLCIPSCPPRAMHSALTRF
jgi:ferredoxin